MKKKKNLIYSLENMISRMNIFLHNNTSQLLYSDTYIISSVLTGLKGPIILEAIPFPSILLEPSSFFSPSFLRIPFENQQNMLVQNGHP